MAIARGGGARLLLGGRSDRVFRGAALWAMAAFLLYRATDLVGGFQAWRTAGLPVAR